jgi:probable F420-dependent oxidoreductase
VARFHVGIQIQPQHTSMDALRDAWRQADDMGVDSIWTWDHFFPLYGEPDGPHFEGWLTLATMAADTSSARVGMLVTGNTYRNPDLLADMGRTLDHISGGRAYLGLGAGWFERDYDEYGYEFGTAGSRLRALEDSLQRIRARLGRLEPGPVGEMPILLGGGGEKVTLRLVAQYADAWNTFGPPENFAHKCEVLDEWCSKIGRDPAEIERTVAISGGEVSSVDAYLEAGATHVILMQGAGGGVFDLTDLQRLLEARDA